MDVGKTLYVGSRDRWRKWLNRNHKKAKEIWLVYYKKASGKPTLSVDEAVDEALCFGWIDSQIKPIDESKYASRFTPRRSGSLWSDRNLSRVQKLLKEGRMTPSGMAVLPSGIAEKWLKNID